MKEHKKVRKFDKELLIIIIVLMALIGILFFVEIPGGAFMFFCFGALTFLVIIIFLMYLIDYIPFKIKANRYYKDLEEELAKESTIFYKFQEQKIYLTDKYIVSVPQFPKHNYNILEYSKLIWIYFDEKESRDAISLSGAFVGAIDESLSTTIQMIGMDEKHAYLIAEEKRYDKAKDILNKNKEKIKEKILQPTRLDYIMGNEESMLKEVTDKFKEKVSTMHNEKEMENKEKNILKEITDKIKEKNPKILVGYTIENKQKYEEIVGKKL